MQFASTMKSFSVLAFAALATATIKADPDLGQGVATVINSCDYEVYLFNVPSQPSQCVEDDVTLSANGGTYSQQYQWLNNTDGWSIKLSKEDKLGPTIPIMQYEYTYHKDNDIWYDLSDVNGNPWDGDWEITASTGCNPKQQAYRYSTDDAYGMQCCDSTASITVTLCSGDSSSSGSSGSGSSGASSSVVASSAPAPSSYVAPSSVASSSTPVASPTSVATSVPASSVAAPSSASPVKSYHHHSQYTQAAPTAGEKVQATTLAKAVTTTAPSISNAEVVIVTETEIAYTTVDTYVKRDAHHHAHHPRHPHGARM